MRRDFPAAAPSSLSAPRLFPDGRPWDDLAVAIGVDTSTAFRTNAEVAALIAAVTVGTQHDETSWLELKSTLDLSSKEGQFAIARALLGISNRDPAAAATWCEGTGYVLVGADHDGLHGVTTVDIADVEKGVNAYLGTGADSPRWSARYVDVSGVTVLVVTVEAPKYGDRIKTLRREFGNARAGAVFVRGQAKTETATPGEIEMLEDRLTRGAQDPAMTLTVHGRVSEPGLFTITDYSTPGHAAEWIDVERKEVTDGVPPEPPPQQRTGTALDRLMSAQGLIGGMTDRRPSFAKEVSTYLETCLERLPTVMRGMVCRLDRNKLAVVATNDLETTLTSVRVVVGIDAAAAEVLDWPPAGSRLPGRPKYEWSPLGNIGAFRPQMDDLRVASRGPGAVSVERRGSVWHAAWTLGDIHPDQTVTGKPVTVIPANAQGPVELRWSATASNRRGVERSTEQAIVVTDRLLVLPHSGRDMRE